MERQNNLSIYKTNLLYLVLAIIFLTIGGFTQNINLFFGILITEVLIIAIPSICFVKRKGISLKKTFRLNRLGSKNTILILFITILTYPIAVFFQAIFISLLNIFIPLNPAPLPDAISQIPFIWSVFFIGLVPGICEEIMFRGTILKAYENLGIRKAIIISGILFGMFHFTIINFMGPTVLGIVFGIMVYKTNSIYSSMLAHTINNSIALTINHFVMKNANLINDMSPQDLDMGLNNVETVISFITLGVLTYLLIKLVKVLLSKLSSSTKEDLYGVETENSFIEEGYIEKEHIKFSSYIPLLIVIIMYLIFNVVFILG